MEPTPEQLRTFYTVVRQAVLMSSYISFVELGRDSNLYIYIGRYDSPATFVIYSCSHLRLNMGVWGLCPHQGFHP